MNGSQTVLLKPNGIYFLRNLDLPLDSRMPEKLTYEQLEQRLREAKDEALGYKKLIATLQENERKYRLLAESASDIIWTRDLDLQVTYVSPSVTKILGFTPEEWMHRQASEVMTPDSYHRTLDILKLEMETESKGNASPDRSQTLEIQCYHKKGHTVWTENIVRWIRNDRGELIGIYGVSRDITKRKQAEHALQEHDALFQKLSSHIPGIIFQFKNGQMEPIACLSPRQLLKKSSDVHRKMFVTTFPQSRGLWFQKTLISLSLRLNFLPKK